MSLEVRVIHGQIQSLVAQRDEYYNKHQQCVGALSILEEQLRFIVEAEAAKKKEEEAKLIEDANKKLAEGQEQPEVGKVEPVEPEQQGDVDGEVKHEEQGQATQE